jgi:ribonuclease HII
MKPDWVIGIDEVGRGSLAGPVVVCAAAIPKNFRYSLKDVPCKLRDSKRLTPKQRQAWFKYLTQHPALCYSIARVYPRGIEKLNIASAANLAALRALRRLVSALCVSPFSPRISRILLDGGLYLGGVGKLPGATTVIRGDEKYSAVKIASIIAKVSRDRLMARLAKKYPAYGFEIHKGYGTQVHLAAIRRCGPSPIHRLTFLDKLCYDKPEIQGSRVKTANSKPKSL